MNVLIVEDEKSLSTEISHFLKREGYICETSATHREASEKLYVNEYDFVLLDLGLPDSDGLKLLEEARELKKEAAFIILTARGDVADRIKGLELGADDYLPKPFSLHELHARMQAILRRKHGLKNSVVEVHGFHVDIAARTVSYEGKTVTLTKKEFDLLQQLLLFKNRVVTRLQLIEHIWGNILDDDYDSNYIDVHVKNLRKKLSAYAPVDWIETVRGVGYRLNL